METAPVNQVTLFLICRCECCGNKFVNKVEVPQNGIPSEKHMLSFLAVDRNVVHRCTSAVLGKATIIGASAEEPSRILKPN